MSNTSASLSPAPLSAAENVSALTPQDAYLVVAFASHEGDIVDEHFGSAQAFYVYDIHPERAELIGSIQFAREAKDGNEDKLKPKLAWLTGSDVVYCASIGGSATRQLIAMGITPMKVSEGPDISELIEGIQAQLSGSMEFWLANILKQKQKSAGTDRFSVDEEWG
ncbi:MAG TPA: NifB/NifX family molybdenum-iron cluster-binding protein [Cellvibrionaceae bacterium]|nr:NifB/NifX family molybdenum-iron cluster-binding protein [Cellvibrionaceae bacterium]HMW47008.1 NifB/NifX family molybdenum-iron cluster-binding protein [Cellvibrionaceae bacterium]HMW72887.1 NifB/NifX family molybdenum-iron cluster-binding protein [Cellvibrionaceae bacterium]HMY38198.1 NifB/NifX family molybdenum-iron cluster-binding protein [Marinagarivorans sp.]HNG60004.1 NifB/NifX family molybdenum-iron cluster-binding protein [Cellvibrionaceae bacterium]